MDPTLAHLTSWAEHTKGEVPMPLTGPTLSISPLPAPHPPTVFLFGGKLVHNRKLTSEMWAMDLSTRLWERVDAGEGPGPRYFHSMDVWEDKLVCFGGMSDSEPVSVHNDIWFFDCLHRRWLPQPTPSSADNALLPAARYAHLSAVSRGKLVISGGQHSDNSWIYEISVYDLKRREWLSKTEQPELQGLHSKGAYRSVATSSKTRVITPSKGGDGKGSASHSYSIDEEGEGGDIWCYSNYDFAKVRRELDVLSPHDDEHEATRPPADQPGKHASPPSFAIRDASSSMRGTSQPPGLRFPTGGIVGNHFILCGLYLASSSAAFSIWALNLDTMAWRHLEPAVLGSGSWNRAVIWPEAARILVFGNAASDLAGDYGRRAVNLDQIAVISLETYGIYRPPRLEIPTQSQELGLTMLDEKLASDFDVICDDGRRMRCSRQILSARWPWFAEQERDLADKLAGTTGITTRTNGDALDITDTLLGNFNNPAKLSATCLSIPEPFPVCVALVQYFYTLSLSTPLQNRAPVLSALLFMAKQYKIERLGRLVVHALHERLDPSVAVGIYEIATLAGEQNLQVRALNMIHAGKHTSRGHRQGPSGSTGAENGSTADPPAYSTDSAPLPDAGGNNLSLSQQGGRSDEGAYRRARVDSLTLPDNDTDPDHAPVHVTALLAALEVTRPVAPPPPRAVSPIDNAPPPPRRHPARMPPPPARPPPIGRIPSFPQTPDLGSYRSSSPTNTESTGFPSTPSESISVRESAILPPREFGSLALDSRSSSGHLAPLLEDASRYTSSGASLPARSRSASRPQAVVLDRHISPTTLERAGFPAPPARPYPPTGYQLSPSGLTHTAGTSSYFDDEHSASFSGSSSVPSLSRNSSMSHQQHARPFPPERHHSIATQSSGSSLRSGGDFKHDLQHLQQLDPFEATRGPEFNIDLRMQGAKRGMQSSVDLESISSDSTGVTSKQKMTREEKKAAAAAEKAAKKAEAQARFEALRSEQMMKMAIARADAEQKAKEAERTVQDVQRVRELVKKEAPVVAMMVESREKEMGGGDKAAAKKEKKSAGGWGKRFAGAVLFPSGGEGTMF